MLSLTKLSKIICFLSIGGFINGYHTGVIAGVFIMKSFINTFGDEQKKLSSTTTSIIIGFLSLGAVIGALLAGKTSDWLSRKHSITLFSAVFLLSIIAQTSCSDLATLVISRIFSGMTVGAFSVIIPVYLSEIATKEHRGRTVTLLQLGITIGIGTSFWIDYGFYSSISYSQWSWRIPFMLQIIPALIFGIGIRFCPFSPRWLMSKGREDEALNVLRTIRSAYSSDIQAEFEEIKRELLLENENEPPQSCLQFRNPTFLRRLILGIGIQLFQQFSGINSIIYYAPDIFNQLGYGHKHAFSYSTGINGLVNIIFTIPTVILIDKVGRRLLFLSGAIVMTLSLLIGGSVMGTYGSIQTSNMTDTIVVNITNPVAAYTVITNIYLFVAAFAFSWGPVMWVYTTELCPLSMRAKGTSIMLATNWAANCGLSFLIPILLQHMWFQIYIIFGIFCFIIGILTFFFYPETKGIPLEKMDRIFRGRIIISSCSRTNLNENEDFNDPII